MYRNRGEFLFLLSLLVFCGFVLSGKVQKRSVRCIDRNRHCRYWAGRGYCNTNRAYMLSNCPMSCRTCSSQAASPASSYASPGSCRDSNNYCRGWAQTGECSRNSGYMLKFCRMSCNRCQSSRSSSTYSSCADLHRNCASWARLHYCRTNPGYMNVNCRKSCGLCQAVRRRPKPTKRKRPTPKKTHVARRRAQGRKKPGNKHVHKGKKPGNKHVHKGKKPGDKQVHGGKKPGDKHVHKGKKPGNKHVHKGKKPGDKQVHGGNKKKPESTKNPSKSINDRYCGLRIRGRVVGGEDAAKGSWPWQVAIASKIQPKKIRCGGTLINRQWVATASHCFGSVNSKIFQPANLVVRLGEHDMKKDEGSEIVSDVSMLIRHQRYRTGSYDNDIALIKLAKPIKYNALIKPICLPEQGKAEKVNFMCHVTGWGRISEYGKVANILQEARVPVVNRASCMKTLNILSRFTSNMICAGYSKGGIDTCQGDSGGPFACKNRGRFELIGISSWGKGCGEANVYSAYTKVSNYVNWIKTNIQN